MPSVTPACTTEGGISRRVLTVLGMMNVVEGFTMNVIWPFLPFMVENFGVATEETVGLYVGILGKNIAQHILHTSRPHNAAHACFLFGCTVHHSLHFLQVQVTI